MNKKTIIKVEREGRTMTVEIYNDSTFDEMMVALAPVYVFMGYTLQTIDNNLEKYYE